MQPSVQVEDLVVVLGESLRSQGSAIAQRLRKGGRRVDLVLEAKKMKWVFKVCVPVCALLQPPYQCLLHPWHRHRPLQASAACTPVLCWCASALSLPVDS